jgi:hypothetical protein
MGSVDVVSVVGAAVVVVIDSMVMEVVDISRVIDESVVSTNDSAAAVEVTEVTDDVVSIAITDSIDETNNVSVDTSEVAADVVAVKTSNSVSNPLSKWSIKCSIVLTRLAGARNHRVNGQ